MLVVKKMPKSISAEAYRILRTKLKYSGVDTDIKTIVITAAEASEGKSTIAGNLAATLSDNGSRVVIVDCDLRKPAMHKRFNVTNNNGLTEYLVGEKEFRDVIKIIEDNLHFISAGDIPPNPAEIIGSRKLESFLKLLKLNYDYVIIDTPPIMAVTDSRILAAKADATLMVVRSGKTKASTVHRGYEELVKVGANVVGSVINDLGTDRKDTYYYYYEEENKKKFSFKLFKSKKKKRRR